MRVYQCEDSLEGIFTAIYNIYEDKVNREEAVISLTEELFLFAEYIPVEMEKEKAWKVANTLRRRFGEEDYWRICLALSAEDSEKAQAVYRTILQGMENDCKQGGLLDNLADDNVHRVFVLSRAANNEYLHLRGFTRFSELENGILYSEIGPKNNILTFLMPHFAERFPLEHFVLHDDVRNLFGVHPVGKEWYLVQGKEKEGTNKGTNRVLNEGLKLSGKEREYQELFRFFCREISIEERKNLELQRNMLPLRFRAYMTEHR